jgi:drug/metabolite transporter (DMT)-like permease
VNTPGRKTWFPSLALAFGLLAIGTSAILIRLAGTSGVIAVLYRMAIGQAAIFPFFVNRARSGRRPPPHEMGIAVLAGLFFAVDLLAWSSGVVMGGATNPTLMANTAPLWVGLGAWLLFGERQRRRFWFGLLLTMVGAVTVLGLDAVRSFDLGFGTFLGLVAGIFYGSYFLVSQRGRQAMDVFSYFWISSLTSAVVLLAFALATGQPIFGYSIRTYAVLIAMGLGPQALGWLAINYAQGHVPASVVSTTMLGQPVVTAVLAGPILGEAIGPLQILSGLVVLFGIWIVHTSQQPKVLPVAGSEGPEDRKQQHDHHEQDDG